MKCKNTRSFWTNDVTLKYIPSSRLLYDVYSPVSGYNHSVQLRLVFNLELT